MQKIKSDIGIAVVLVAWVAFAAYVLIGLNSEVLYTAEERNVFVGGTQFFTDTIAQPFGVFKYVGAFLTQLFYHPALGASLLIVLWVASIVAGIKAFSLKGTWMLLMIMPVACLLAATIDLGYWIYCLNIHGYWFSQSVAVLCFLLLLWAADATPRRYRLGWYAVVGLAAFPAFGWYSYLFALCLFLLQWRKGATPTWVDGTGVTLAAVAPLIFRALCFKGISLTQLFLAGFPHFKTATNESLRPSLPFIIMAGVLVALSFSGVVEKLRRDIHEESPKKRFRSVLSIAVPLLFVAVSAYGVWTSMFKDDNYIYEMQMNRATMDDDWSSVISVAEKAARPSQTMVMLKNIALMNTGELGERSFELGNNGINITNPDSLYINIMHIAAPVIYLNYGQYNYAMRWSMEFAVHFGFSPYYMKVIARAATQTGEKRLAKRFTDRLHRMLYYSDWKPAPPSACAQELNGVTEEVLGWDDNDCERFIIKTFSLRHGVDSKLHKELSLFYSIIGHQTQDFWAAFPEYFKTRDNQRVPMNYEEAYVLYANQREEKDSLHVKVSMSTINRFKEYWADGNRYAGMYSDPTAIADAMAEEWGNTCWWYAAFGRKDY